MTISQNEWTHQGSILAYFNKGFRIYREVLPEDETVLQDEHCYAAIRYYVSRDELVRTYELLVFGMPIMRGSRFDIENDYLETPNAFYHNGCWHYTDIGDYVKIEFRLTPQNDLEAIVFKLFGLTCDTRPKFEIVIKNPRLNA